MCGVTIFFAGMCAFLIYDNLDYLIFRHLIVNHYIHGNTLDEIFRDTLGPDSAENHRRYFDKAVIGIVTERIREVGNDIYTYLYTPMQYRQSQEFRRVRANNFSVEQISEDTVHVNIPNISRYTREKLQDSREYIDQFENIVIDLRSNSGGMLSELYRIADMFLERGSVIGIENARMSLFTRTATATSRDFMEFESIYILQNEFTASAAEGLIMALKYNLENVTSVGTQSFGKGIGQITLPIRRGFAIRATVLEILTPQRETIHNTGIEPDVWYEGEDIIYFVLNM